MSDPIARSIEHKQRGELPQALDELDRAIRDGFDLPRAHYQRGLTLVAMGRDDEAIAAYETAIDLRPEYARALVNLAALHMERQDAASANRLLERAAPLVGENDPIFLFNRAMVQRMMGKAGPALRDAKRAAELAPDEPEMWIELGLCYLMDPRRATDAIAANRRALELDPNRPRAAHNLAAALDGAGDPAAALPFASQALEQSPNDLTFAQTKACVLLHLDRAHDALPLLEAVERGRPDHFEAQYNLAC